MKVIFQIIVLLTCLPFFAVGIYEAYESHAELKTFARAAGIVTGNSYATTTDNGIISGAYHPRVTFTDADGRKNSFTDGIGSLPADYETGAAVEVIYDPQNSAQARIYSLKRFWLAPCIFIAVGIVPIAVAFVIMRKLNL